MSVSIQLLSYPQAQRWAARISAALTADGSGVESKLIGQSLLAAWGMDSWSALRQRPAFPFDEGDTAPLALSQVKRWTTHQRRWLKEQGQPLSLNRLQAAWARALGASTWASVPPRLDQINALRAEKMRRTPSLPRRHYPFDLERYPLHTLPQPVQDRLMELGQHWINANYTRHKDGYFIRKQHPTRWQKFWPRITQAERSVVWKLARSGVFEHIQPLPTRKTPPLSPLDPAMEEPLWDLAHALCAHYTPIPEAIQALVCLQNVVPPPLRWPPSALADIAELLVGEQRRCWYPFGWAEQAACFQLIAHHHAPHLLLDPRFESTSCGWATRAMDLLFEERLDTVSEDFSDQCYAPGWRVGSSHRSTSPELFLSLDYPQPSWLSA